MARIDGAETIKNNQPPQHGYGLAFDGKRFLMVKFEQGKLTPVTEMIVVETWFLEFKRLIPSGKG